MPEGQTIRCKFRCHSSTKRTRYNGGFVWDFQFGAVTDGGAENKRFFDATPAGDIKVSSIQEDHFEVGNFYYVDFTPAEDKA